MEFRLRTPAKLAAAAGNRARVIAVPPDKVLSEIADADAVVSFRLTREQVQAAKKLTWIQNPFAGVEQLVSIPEIRDSAITLTNAKIIAGPNIAARTGTALALSPASSSTGGLLW